MTYQPYADEDVGRLLDSFSIAFSEASRPHANPKLFYPLRMELIPIDMEKPGVFLRRSSGLVREWSIWDAAFFQSWSTPLYATYTFSLAVFWPNANLILAIFLLAIWAGIQCLAYTFLVVSIPRAGSDYVWQSRLLHPTLAFAVVFPGWLIVLPLFITINTWVEETQFVSPIFALLGNLGGATWVISNDGVFVGSIITLLYTFTVCAFGLRWYARVQNVLYVLSMIGVFALIVSFATSNSSTFAAGLNSFYHDKLGYSGTDAYQDIIQAAKQQGLSTSLNWNLAGALPLLPVLAFFGIYPTWSSPMYGEVREVTDVGRTHLSFQFANIPLNILNAIIVFVVWNAAGYEFFQSANYLFWMSDTTHMPLYPSIPLWVYFVTGSAALTLFIMFFNMAFFVTINGAGNGYLIVSRMMFAMSFDQIIPSWFASLKTKWRIPLAAYVYTFVIGVIFSWLYAYNILGFRVIWLDSVFSLVVPFMLTAIAGIVLPFKRPDIFKSSPASKYKLGPVPVMTLCGILYVPFSLYTMYVWAVDPTYGVNNLLSAQFLTIVYGLAVVVYAVSKYYRKTKGIDLNLAYMQVPAD